MAAETLRLAGETTDAEIKQNFVAMALRWQALAIEVEKTQDRLIVVRNLKPRTNLP